MPVRDSHQRSLLKGFTWRFLGTIDTILISWAVTGNPLKALSIGGIEIFTKVILYYLHERIWQKIPWGRGVVRAVVYPKERLKNIHPVFDKMLSRTDREAYLQQRSKVIWLTGLSGSGKSTIAQLLEKKLFEAGVFCQVLDGDNIRSGINSNLGFSVEDRQENIRRIAEVAKLFLNSGVVSICSFISPTRQMRQLAKNIVGPEDFIEVFVDTPLELCEKRDVKGLYKKARQGEIENFTGVSATYEAPENPDLVLHTEGRTAEASAQELFEFILPSVKPGARISNTSK